LARWSGVVLFAAIGRYTVVEEDKKGKKLDWLTFTMHPIELKANHTTQAQGQLIDGGTYALQLTVIRIDTEAATLSYAGRVGEHSFSPRQVTIPFVIDQPVQLNVTDMGQMYRNFKRLFSSTRRVLLGESSCQTRESSV
jgi:hypothetical protein